MCGLGLSIRAKHALALTVVLILSTSGVSTERPNELLLPSLPSSNATTARALREMLLVPSLPSFNATTARALREMDAEGCKQHWQRREAYFRNVREAHRVFWSKHPAVHAKGHENRAEWFDAFEPSYNCDSRERIGGPERFAAFGDGPKFMCGVDQLPKNCLVYNVGSRNEFDFEQGLKVGAPWCEIHTFDPMPDEYKAPHLSTFHRIGIAGNELARKAGNTRSISELIRQLGHTGRRIDVFKIDCEGCEFHALAPVFAQMATGTLQIGQLLIEMHTSPRTMPSLKYADVLRWFKLADHAGLRMFSKERNAWSGNGRTAVEFSFVDERHACREFCATHCGMSINPSAVCDSPELRSRPNQATPRAERESQRAASSRSI